mgnify:CR=1 FL=1
MDIRCLTGFEELPQAPRNSCKLVPGSHLGILPERNWNQKEEVIRHAAKVTLPKVEQVHIVDGGFASLNLQQDSGVVDWEKVVRSQGET